MSHIGLKFTIFGTIFICFFFKQYQIPKYYNSYFLGVTSLFHCLWFDKLILTPQRQGAPIKQPLIDGFITSEFVLIKDNVIRIWHSLPNGMERLTVSCMQQKKSMTLSFWHKIVTHPFFVFKDLMWLWFETYFSH